MFQSTKEDPERDPSAAVWNMLTFQTTSEGRFSAGIGPLSLQSEHVMFQTQSWGPTPRVILVRAPPKRVLLAPAPAWTRRAGLEEVPLPA